MKSNINATMKSNLFIIIHPRRAESRLNLNLVKDAGGTIVEKTKLGIIVQVKRSVGKALNLLQIIQTESLDIVRSI